jgi:hypothetical protein
MVPNQRVTVKGGDYTYEGWIVAIFSKRSGATRYVVEDDNGRLFIHNDGQIASWGKYDQQQG